jgi:hypothetical protein
MSPLRGQRFVGSEPQGRIMRAHWEKTPRKAALLREIACGWGLEMLTEPLTSHICGGRGAKHHHI